MSIKLSKITNLFIFLINPNNIFSRFPAQTFTEELITSLKLQCQDLAFIQNLHKLWNLQM